MAALTADKRRVKQGAGDKFPVPVAASTTIHGGAMVCFDASGNAVPAADTAGLDFAGIACARADNASGSAGDIEVEVERGQLEKIATAVVVAGDKGLDAVVADDQTVTDSAAGTNDVRVGKIEKFETGFAWVRVGVLSTAAA